MIDSSATTVTTPPTSTPLSLQKPIGWGGRVLFVILALFAALYYAAIVASTIKFSPLPGNDIFWGSLGCGGAAAYFNKWRGRPARSAFVVGLTISCVIGFAPDASSRVQAHRLLATLRNSVNAFDPVAAAKWMSIPDNTLESRQTLQAAIAHALQQAPDSAVVAFDDDRLRLIVPSSETDLARCVSAARGSGSEWTNVGAGFFMIEATTNLFRAAASTTISPPALDVEKARTKLAPIVATAAPAGELDDLAKFESLSGSTQCRIYMNLMHGVHSLPTADAALVVRYLSSR
jgi:hypothetical protein